MKRRGSRLTQQSETINKGREDEAIIRIIVWSTVKHTHSHISSHKVYMHVQAFIAYSHHTYVWCKHKHYIVGYK